MHIFAFSNLIGLHNLREQIFFEHSVPGIIVLCQPEYINWTDLFISKCFMVWYYRPCFLSNLHLSCYWICSIILHNWLLFSVCAFLSIRKWFCFCILWKYAKCILQGFFFPYSIVVSLTRPHRNSWSLWMLPYLEKGSFHMWSLDWEMILDSLGEPKELGLEEKGTWWQKQRSEWCPLKMHEGATSQG